MKTVFSLLAIACCATLAAAQPVRLRVDFSKPDGTWNMPVLALGQGGLQADPMIEPHIKELRQLQPRTIRLFLSGHIRDCFVDPMDFDWMSPGGRRFMAHWWNTMPQYSALFDHHGRVRPAWYAFRLLGQLDGPRYAVEGEQGNLRAIAGDGDGYKHLIVWRYEDGGADEIEVRLDLAGLSGRNSRVVKLDAAAPVNNIQVIHFGRSNDLGEVPLKLKPWDVRWVEVE